MLEFFHNEDSQTLEMVVLVNLASTRPTSSLLGGCLGAEQAPGPDFTRYRLEPIVAEKHLDHLILRVETNIV